MVNSDEEVGKLMLDWEEAWSSKIGMIVQANTSSSSNDSGRCRTRCDIVVVVLPCVSHL
jgi:hypothetical protein